MAFLLYVSIFTLIIMNKLESKPKPKIISTEVQNEALMFSINKAIQELKVEFSIDDLEEEKLGDVFRHVYNSIMPLNCKEAGYIFNRDEDIEGLTNKALEFVEEAKLKLFGIAFLELLFLAVSASSEKFLKDKGESDRITTRFLTFSQQLDWLDDKKRKILRSFLKLHGSGGNIASQYPWNYETCIAFVNMVDRVKPLWEFILDFYKSRKASTNRLALLKKEDTFQTLSNSYTPELIEKVVVFQKSWKSKKSKRKFKTIDK